MCCEGALLDFHCGFFLAALAFFLRPSLTLLMILRRSLVDFLLLVSVVSKSSGLMERTGMLTFSYQRHSRAIKQRRIKKSLRGKLGLRTRLALYSSPYNCIMILWDGSNANSVACAPQFSFQPVYPVLTHCMCCSEINARGA